MRDGHRVRGLRPEPGRGQVAWPPRARPGRRAWPTSWPSWTSRGPCGSWCRPASWSPTLEQLRPLLEADDIVIDGGNSYYRDDITRAADLKRDGIHYIDVGTSGGVWGLERGYCLMIGGEDEPVRRLNPIFLTIAPGRGMAEPTPGLDQGRHRRAGLPALRAERRRALRQDGAQRDRVRHDGRDRRGPVDHQARRRGPAPGRDRRGDHAAAQPRGLPVHDRRRARSPRSGGAARWSAPGWST